MLSLGLVRERNMFHCLPHSLICSCLPHMALQPVWVQLELLDGFGTSVCAGRLVRLHYSSLVRITAEDENDAWRLYFFPPTLRD